MYIETEFQTEQHHFEAKLAFIVHQCKNDDPIIMRHEVTNNQIGYGRFINAKEMVDAISKTLNLPSANKNKFMDDKILLDDSKRLIWFTKRQQKTLWFKFNNTVYHYTVTVTPLLWICTKNKKELRVFALPSNQRPTFQTRLYHTPFMNINLKGVLCQGTAPLPKKIAIDMIDHIEASLFDSCFTHVNHSKTIKAKGKSNVSSKQLLAFWRNKAKTKQPVYCKELNFAGLVENKL
jgi:PRTRC genetic system protein B